MEDSGYIVGIGILGLIFFLTAITALFWASKNGQLRNFEKGARTIFDDEEPEGTFGDGFPDKRDRKDPEVNPEEREQPRT